MTLEQATQKILDKALSLTDGWVETYEDYSSAGVIRHYRNPALPDIVLVHDYDPRGTAGTAGTVGTARLVTTRLDFLVTSDALLKHVGVIRESVARAAQKAKEDSIIAIAQQTNP